MNDEKANKKQDRNMRWKGNEPARPIDENHLSTQKQSLRGALISEPSIPSEMLTSDPPLTPPQRAFTERECVKERERKTEEEQTRTKPRKFKTQKHLMCEERKNPD